MSLSPGLGVHSVALCARRTVYIGSVVCIFVRFFQSVKLNCLFSEQPQKKPRAANSICECVCLPISLSLLVFRGLSLPTHLTSTRFAFALLFCLFACILYARSLMYDSVLFAHRSIGVVVVRSAGLHCVRAHLVLIVYLHSNSGVQRSRVS